jgi:hypothetical protein
MKYKVELTLETIKKINALKKEFRTTDTQLFTSLVTSIYSQHEDKLEAMTDEDEKEIKSNQFAESLK